MLYRRNTKKYREHKICSCFKERILSVAIARRSYCLEIYCILRLQRSVNFEFQMQSNGVELPIQ